ncbi:hypothetical protein D3218_02955 [Aureimonas flava]|uniref:DUF4383 domain-containing protein n=1 Tax=Aureimonas flava TaxID=2320271 RepID=A0A3A1WRL7_9HYPH|nr:hypothetical protein [Aureimonas flava]RIY03713.1 hypothetical protein D3218_02955 [Aureimonas flava]
MKRIPTTFALSTWAGFLAVTGANEILHLNGHLAIGGVALELPAGTGPVSWGVAMLCIGTAALLAVGLIRVHAADEAEARRGELLGFAGIGICAAMVIAASLFGAPFAAVFDRLDLAVWSIGLSLVALAFDACIFAPDDEDELDEIAFRRTVAAINASIPRRRDERSGRDA